LCGPVFILTRGLYVDCCISTSKGRRRVIDEGKFLWMRLLLAARNNLQFAESQS